MWAIKICMEDAGRLQFINIESKSLPRISPNKDRVVRNMNTGIEENEWLEIIDSNNMSNNYLLSHVIAYSCWKGKSGK
jgi:hypothetical protein